MMKVDLAEPLAPGRAATLEIAWHFLVPEHGADRMGRDGALYEIAQWYPRVAVYDDVRGWNIEPYLGQGEFYLDFGNYTLAVTVPAGYIVAATGALQNAREVLTADAGRAPRAGGQVATPSSAIVTADELPSGAARPRTTGTLTWRFAPKNVRDAVWAASPDYQWDAIELEGHHGLRVLPARARPSNWHDAADQSRMSIQEYSERWFPYPWPHISAVEGPISGMEYPMIAMENKSARRVRPVQRRHPRDRPHVVPDDRRLATSGVHVAGRGLQHLHQHLRRGAPLSGKGDQMARAPRSGALVEQVMAAGVDEPVDINPDRINPRLLGHLRPT